MKKKFNWGLFFKILKTVLTLGYEYWNKFRIKDGKG